MNKLPKILLGTTFLLLLAGCGAKGPLVLPERAEPEPPSEEQPVDQAEDQAVDQTSEEANDEADDEAKVPPVRVPTQDVPAAPAAND